MKIKLAELAKLTNGELEGDGEFVVEGAAGLAEAGGSDVSFLGNLKYAAQARETRAGCVFLASASKGLEGPKNVTARLPPTENSPPRGGRIPDALPHGEGVGSVGGGPEQLPKNRIYVEDPQWAFAQVLALIEPERMRRPLGVTDPKASVHYEAKLGREVAVGPFAVVDRGAVVGDGTVIGAQCYIGPSARVGKNCLLYSRVTVRDHCVVGDRVILHPGVVVGSDGFGFSTDRKTGAHRKIPQIGNVVIEDDVEIGANTTLDRGTVGTTRVGSGTKIDNLVQIAHNVQLGRNCLVVAQVGISGSTKVGNQVVLAGQAGIVGHISIGDGAIVAAQSGVMGDVEPKAVLFGSPARPHREAMKLQALLGRLPEIYEAFKRLNKPGPADVGARREDHAGR